MNDPEFSSLSGSKELMPQEEKLEVGKSKASLFIGVPRETGYQERRVGITPDGVNLLVRNGHHVKVETMAGKGANYSDQDYSEAGAAIAYDAADVFKSDIILKVAPPSLEEIQLMKHKQTLISSLQLKTRTKAYFQKLTEKKVTALSYESTKDEDGVIPVVRSMSEIAGNTAVLVAAENLSNANDGKGLMLGGISGVPPTEIVIIGAGTVGEFATRTALGLGASVKVFDKSLSRLRRLQTNLHTRIYTCVVQPKILEKALMRCDVAIGAIRSDSGRTPCIVTEDMVRNMKAGAVIVDISIDQGGCFETSELTTHDQPTFKKYDVVHYCVPNIASRVARTASFSLNNIFAPILLSIGEEGGVENMLRGKRGVRCGLYMYNGILTKQGIGEWFQLPFHDVNLLIGNM